MKLADWIGLLGLITALLLLWSLRDVLILLFAAIVIAMAICTLVGVLQQRTSCSRPLALLLALLSLVLVGITVATVVIPPFISQFQQLLEQLPEAARTLVGLIREWQSWATQAVYGRGGSGAIWLQQLFPEGWPGSSALSDGLSSGLGGGVRGLLGLAGNLGNGLLRLLFVLAVSLMIAVQPGAYRQVFVLLVPSFYRRRFRAILTLCGEALSSWMVGLLISSLFVAILAGLGLLMLGVKLVVANALLAGLLNVIPNVGPTLSTVFPMAVALLENPWKALAVLVLYVLVQNVESYLITPSVMQHQVQLLPGLTLSAQFVFTVLFGPLGLLMALPLAVVLQVFIREILIHDILDPWRQRRRLA
ncbi:AI-2E family transporter [Synechococcus sp. RSCCF101]|uniref:AI-2E family transporter n=1 Tax=Synechococcus sp. RSCCF101 TaxID=2511069 RepID=UPI001245F816|nr:AI-2E family transporter [Synechococcus sp. RSCCF101]QEY31586.1 AI-2E family transporter [Synechococcus sp. RSCCF101]